MCPNTVSCQLGTTEHLIIFETLNSIEGTLFYLLNEFDESLYPCGVVNLSDYVLNDHEKSIIKSFGFLLYSRGS